MDDVKDFDLWLRLRTARRQSIAYALTDEHLTVLMCNQAMNEWATGGVDDLVGQHLPDVFYELVGIEDFLYHLAINHGDTFAIPRIYRSTSDGQGRYFDLQIEPLAEFGTTLLVLAMDVTEQALMEQRLRQRRNELLLLQAQLSKANEQLTYLLHHFVPQEVARKLVSDPHLLRPGGEQREATVLFADARDFTSMAESLPPDQVLDTLNAHFEVIAEAIRKYDGTLIEYVGDMVMAAFNVPDDQPGHALLGAQAALDIQRGLARFADECLGSNMPVLHFGVGLNTGPVIAGYQGTRHLYKFATLGDTTNVAFHICSRAAGGQVLISQHSMERLGRRAHVTPLGTIHLKRRRALLPIYELLGLEDAGTR